MLSPFLMEELKMSKINVFVTCDEKPKVVRLKKEDVWGEYDHENSRWISEGMIVARPRNICPVFGDEVPYKAVTVICDASQYIEVAYWLSYVHGGDCITKEKVLDDGKIAIRSEYKCW